MKKKIFRLACCLAACSMFAFVGCTDVLSLLFGDEDKSDKKDSYSEDEWNPNEDPMASVSSKDESEDDTVVIEPVDPNPDKTLLRTETDGIGHEIAYYTDGTCEDLGRTVPIDFTPTSPQTKEGYQYFSTLNKSNGLCSFYEDIYTVSCNFHASDKNVTKTNGYYEIANIPFLQYGLTDDEAVSVWRALSLDHPEFFWMDSAVLLSRTSVTMLVSPTYAEASAREEAQEAVEAMLYDCDAYIDSTTSLTERALTIHDYVAGKITYAYKSDGYTPEDAIWAHNVVGGALYGRGVCETYAKTYDYLCETFDLPCITVAGYAIEDGQTFGHAWNVVEVDGAWYNVDITWNDMGTETLSRQWFGTDPEEFVQTHDAFTPEDGWNVNFMYALPTFAKEGLNPVRAAKTEDIQSGKYTAQTAPMYPNIEAVCGLLSEGVTYEAYLYPQTSATAKRAEIVTEGATLYRVPHTAGTLVINGSYLTYGDGYYQMACLSSPDAIAFMGDVVLRNVSYSAPSLTLNGSTLTTTGRAVEITVDGVIVGGNLTDKTTEWTDITAVRLNTLTAQGTELRLLGGGEMERANIHSGTLRLGSAKDVTIGTLWYATANEQLYIDRASAATKITIGDITAGITANEEAGTSAVIPNKVRLTVVYTSANDYPSIQVKSKTTDAKLYLLMHGNSESPYTLGKAFINLGDSVSLSALQVAYTWFSFTRDLAQGDYEKLANGDVCIK
ncbi:MAG: hypothetical protein E7352_03635 [Clostridiales bacterium]|nr:hypothetical protein [Clostridiales bacterium]